MLNQTLHSETETLVIDRADRCGLLFSGLCVLHCLALPTVISLIPVLTLTELSTSPVLQIAAFSLSSFFAVRAVSTGYRLHRSGSVVTLAIAGVALQMGSAWLQSCQCASLPSTVHAADCPCRDLCGWMASGCRYVATTTPAVTTAYFSMAWMSPIGAILFVIAHLRNWQLRKTHELCLSARPAPCA
ncbi:MAG: MerC domain-containing protein [Planctomyces sp.]|nr:MerC domain-containing protein [Planctomyces sp.]